MAEEDDIRAVLKDYFDGLYFGNMEQFRSAFDPACRLFTVADDAVSFIDYDAYMERCEKRAAPVSTGAEQIAEILELTVSTPDTAHARVRDAFPPRTFVNELSLAKSGGKWRIVSKLYHPFD